MPSHSTKENPICASCGKETYCFSCKLRSLYQWIKEKVWWVLGVGIIVMAAPVVLPDKPITALDISAFEFGLQQEQARCFFETGAYCQKQHLMIDDREYDVDTIESSSGHSYRIRSTYIVNNEQVFQSVEIKVGVPAIYKMYKTPIPISATST